MSDTSKKRLLLLGGSQAQTVAIRKAKELGYYTVLCDYLPDNPGQYLADEFHLVSTTDKEAVLEVARGAKIDGVVAYASDPAAPTAAYVAETLGLPGNSYDTVRTLANKDLFRAFLKDHGFAVPRAQGFAGVEDALAQAEAFSYPVIVKPADSSGSKGVTVVRDKSGMREAAEFAFSYSRGHRIIVESYIEKAHPYLIGGDIFVENGEIILFGLLNCHRDELANPLVPIGKSYPLQLDNSGKWLAKATLQRLVDEIGFNTGAMNVEMVIDSAGRCWLIDVGPRNGGNMIPDLLGMIFGVDVVEMTLRAAMGEPCRGFYATHNLHSVKDGRFSHIDYSPEIRPKLVRESVYLKPGDEVRRFNNAGDAVGIVFMRFDSESEMARFLSDIGRHIRVVLQ